MRVGLKNIKGVDRVVVSLNQGKATIDFSVGNTVTMKQLQDALSKNGFNTKESDVVVQGQISMESGGAVLHVSGSNEEFKLAPDTGAAAVTNAVAGKTVVVTGKITVTSMGKVPADLRFTKIEEVR